MMTLIDNMLRERVEGIERVNEMFGTDIRVKLANIWEKKEQAEETEMAVLEQQEETADEPPVENPVEIVEDKNEEVSENVEA